MLIFENFDFLFMSGLKNNFWQIPFFMKISDNSGFSLANVKGDILILFNIFLFAPFCNNFLIIRI